ncbi:hypothetical protein ILUMI_17063 [Ignelater luminosus]|uniref:Uncharacterized protein n=1 Tax=Ignelater luminosus TaxID=2038154 RepID=A0A8K0G293_IGNLU|nr:hypothetical protein ILUMI_17063 [Ignelater luminosus]
MSKVITKSFWRDATTKRKKVNVVPGLFEDSQEKSNDEDNLPSTSKTQISKRRIFEESKESSEAETNVSEESDEEE